MADSRPDQPPSKQETPRARCTLLLCAYDIDDIRRTSTCSRDSHIHCQNSVDLRSANSASNTVASTTAARSQPIGPEVASSAHIATVLYLSRLNFSAPRIVCERLLVVGCTLRARLPHLLLPRNVSTTCSLLVRQSQKLDRQASALVVKCREQAFEKQVYSPWKRQRTAELFPPKQVFSRCLVERASTLQKADSGILWRGIISASCIKDCSDVERGLGGNVKGGMINHVYVGRQYVSKR